MFTPYRNNPGTHTLNGQSYATLTTAKFVLNTSLLNLYNSRTFDGVIIAIDPTGNNQRFTTRQYYLFDNVAVQNYLIPKTQLPCWGNDDEWSAPTYPVEFDQFKFSW